MENKKFLELLKVINDNTRLTIIQMLSNNGKYYARNSFLSYEGFE